ncbi:hypothetical protein POJ06DRAFT_299839 [Lipomyces tetrasporus]|uniref:F-box domain-containing protein n=1 Tax=Lipomyces tetrasporus TaxID=54092 RepID=A0AAD7VTW7_9ASCO|nr:uncharacterized protein POJ06DRAFT_299839 [Lipomyces tetrasporus]KAJ8101903.1 hypothetical protein POJ06DRAFT_299839 [Lipomyces tetrasporus]
MDNTIYGDRRYAVIFESVAWDRETGNGDSGPDYVELGDDLTKRQCFESAYGAYSKALDLVACTPGTIDVLDCLYKRYVAAMKIGAIQFALRDAMEMIYSYPESPMGYVTAGNFYQSQQDYNSATLVYLDGMKVVDSDHNMYPVLMHSYEAAVLWAMRRSNFQEDSDSTPSRVDPVYRLPRELVLKILDQIPLPQRLQLLRVSRAWCSVLYKSLPDVTDISLENCKWPITANKLHGLLTQGRGWITSVALGNVAYVDANACAELVMFGKTATRNGSESKQLQQRDLAGVRAFRFDCCTSVFAERSRFAASWSVLPQLEELRVRIENSPELMQLLADGKLPRLRVLDCYAVEDIVRSSDDVIYLNDTIQYGPQNQLKVLRLGGPAPSSSGFPYVQKLKASIISPRSLQRLLQLLPELEEFYCVNVNSRRITDDMLSRNRISLRLNLRELTPKLRVLDLSSSKMRAVPLVPASCEVINMDFCESLCIRNCETFRGIRYYDDVLDNEGDGYFLQEEADEYKNLRSISVVRSARPFEKIFDSLARCDGIKLRTLNLHGCQTIDFSAKLPSASDFAKYYERYGFEEDPQMFDSAELLVHMFPNLEELRVGCNDTVTDATMDAFKMLDNLRLLDVACTKVSEYGLSSVILKDFNTPDVPKNNVVKLEVFRWTTQARQIDWFKPILKTVIANHRQMSVKSINCLAVVGVRVNLVDHSHHLAQRVEESLYNQCVSSHMI